MAELLKSSLEPYVFFYILKEALLVTVVLIIVYVVVVGYVLYALQQQNQRGVRLEEEIKQNYKQGESKRVEKNGTGQ